MKNEEQIIENSRVIAIVGLSANPERASNRVARHFIKHGFTVIPVNPNEQEILGLTSYPDLGSIGKPVDLVDVFRKSEDVPPIAEAAVKIGAKALWMQEGVENEEAAEVARRAGMDVVMDKCARKVHIRLHGGDPDRTED